MSLKLTTDRELDEFEEMRYLSLTEETALMKLFYRDDLCEAFDKINRDAVSPQSHLQVVRFDKEKTLESA